MENNNKILMEIKQDLGYIKGELKGVINRLDKSDRRFDNHGNRIDKVEGDCDRMQESFKPIKSAYNKLASAGIGVLILIGSVAIGLFAFFKNHLIK